MIVSQQPIRVPSLDDSINFQNNNITNINKTNSILNYVLSLLLSFQNVEIKNFENVEKKLLKIINDGKDSVHLISDFDMTITKYWYNGKRSPSSHDILTRSSKVSENYRKRCEDLKAKFYPIEISPELTTEQKFPYMVEWWENADQAILDEKIHKDTIADMVRETPVVYRQGIKEVLHTCKDKNIPFLVFSAGVQNVIQEALMQSNLYFDNMNVVSNKMAFNEETGICDRFVGPLFHVFNKDNFGLEGTDYEKLLENRNNVIICGDSLGDIKMADGVKHETCLSIGFLNLNKEKMLDKYMNTFDIVITDDGPFDLVNEILSILS